MIVRDTLGPRRRRHQLGFSRVCGMVEANGKSMSYYCGRTDSKHQAVVWEQLEHELALRTERFGQMKMPALGIFACRHCLVLLPSPTSTLIMQETKATESM